MTTLHDDRPLQRAGHIGDVDNRYCGAAVFAELAHTLVDPSELVARACGVSGMSAEDREVVRAIALALTSPDARVWPLKLARTLASYGNAHAGLHGAQLLNAGVTMGPGAHASCAASLRWLHDRVGDDPAGDALAAALDEHDRHNRRFCGFGVPLRPFDERIVGLNACLRGHAATRRRYWRFALRVGDAVKARDGIEPNIVLPLSALMLDLGFTPRRCAVFAGAMISHCFTAHAVEAAEQDGPWLSSLPAAAIDDRSPPLRSSTPRPAAATASGPGSTVPRRSLPW
jgi:hypothetical protein